MEQRDPTQRQYAQNPYAAQQAQQSSGQLPGQYNNPASNERFRHQSFVQQSPTTSQSAARAGSDGQQIYGYQQAAQYGAVQAMQTSAMPYAQAIQAHDGQRHVQQPSFQSYGGQTMYGMAQPQSQQQPSPSAFGPVPQYRQRPSAASETLSSQFGVPQNTQYYLAGQAGPTSAPATELTAQQLPSQYQQPAYPQPAPSVPQPYPTAMMDPVQHGAYATYAQQPQYAAQQAPQPVDQAFNDYKSHVRSIFSSVREGNLRDISQPLLHISQYLLGGAETLGLTRDEEGSHDDRIRLWNEFNQAWLTTMQRQFDMTDELLRTGQTPREPQSIMTAQTLEQLSRELVRLCDSVEKHGLVDYQMGVAEEDIMDLILRCLSLLEAPSERAGEASFAETSAAGASRGR